jgi:hypothetical protein
MPLTSLIWYGGGHFVKLVNAEIIAAIGLIRIVDKLLNCKKI